MSIVRSLIVSAILAVTGLAASAQAAATAGHPAPHHAAAHAETTKHAACEKVWAAQKVRHGTRQAFVASCVAKG
ncbi:hypothetical protein [Caulobacter soli]|uniref:hypothetical protein n=1 Tax=Caulobacter soli TaxID=2708539 RepID=UPI0013EC399C|nr:hypothetical protein [Caulobacter soli]